MKSECSQKHWNEQNCKWVGDRSHVLCVHAGDRRNQKTLPRESTGGWQWITC